MSLTTVKSEDKRRKTVFRQLLDSPFNLTWKSVDQTTSQDILDVLCSLLTPLAAHRPQQTTERPRKRKKTEFEDAFVDPPPFVSSLTLGFNATTAHLESEIQEKAVQRMRVVFVARGDTSSAHLYAHFPLLSSMLSHVRLVSLAKGAEARLCETLQMRRVGVVGLLDDAPGADTLFQLVEDKVPKIEHPWVHEGMPSFVPTRVKWVETVVNQAQTGKPEPRKKPKEIHVVDDKI